jgi:putative flippase GtrA
MEGPDLVWRYCRMRNVVGRLKNGRTTIQLIRYGLVGLASNLVGYLVYLFITYLGVAPKIAMSVLYVIGATIGFVGNRRLTFAHKGSLFGAGIRYLIAHCIGYALNLSILIFMVDKLGYPHQWVQAAAIFIVAAYLFFAFKFFVFTEGAYSAGRRE